MYRKKEKLYLYELLDDPAVSYPGYYLLSTAMKKSESLQCALISLHSLDFSGYTTPNRFDDLFTMFASGMFPLYKERYPVGYFGGKMMYLESSGWKSLPATADIFRLENWLVC